MDTRPATTGIVASRGPTPRDGTPFAPLDGTLAASLERSARLAAVSLRAPTAVIALVGDDRRCFVGGVTPPSWLAHDPGLLMRSGICRTVLETLQPVAVDDSTLDGGADDAPLGAGAYVLVPLSADGGRARGIVGVFEAEARRWTPEDITVLVEHAAAAATELALRRSLARRERQER